LNKPNNSSRNTEKATPGKKNPSVVPKPRASKPPGMPWGFFIVDLFTKFGVGGGVIIVVTIVFLGWGSATQKQEFIDRYLLLKWPRGEEKYPYFVLGVILILFLMNWVFNTRKLKLKDERINILTEELKKYQQ
jgi:hypothetical protein